MHPVSTLPATNASEKASASGSDGWASLEAFDRREELVEVIELVEHSCRTTWERLGPLAGVDRWGEDDRSSGMSRPRSSTMA